MGAALAHPPYQALGLQGLRGRGGGIQEWWATLRAALQKERTVGVQGVSWKENFTVRTE